MLQRKPRLLAESGAKSFNSLFGKKPSDQFAGEGNRPSQQMQ